MHRPLNIGGHVFKRTLDGRNDVANAREVKYITYTAEKRVSGSETADIASLERQIRVGPVMREVLFPAADQAIYYPHREAPVEEKIHHVTADESGTTCDHRQRL